MFDDVIHWKELNGNKFLTKFVPEMLCDGGIAIKRSVAISRRNKQMQEIYVVFDRDYVLEVLKSHFDLLEIDIDEACDLASEAMLLLDEQRKVKDD